MHVVGNKDTCVVSSMCVYRVPAVFDQDDDGLIEIVDPDPPAELHDAVRTAVRACPTGSIRLR